VLGPLEVAHVDGLGSRNLRTLLASLLLRPNRPVATADLTERLWAGPPPRAPLRVLQTNVVRLRHVLGHDAIRTTPGGYRITVDTEDLDLLRFDRLLAAATGAEPVREAAILRSALELWRGPVVADVESRAVQAYDVPAIAERRLAALERRIELDVLHGDDRGLVPELRALVAEHPLRERLWMWLMVVLSRQGRQADALDAYRTLAHRLVGELGIEPGTRLREVHQRILRGVDPAPVPPSTVVVSRSVPRQLPAGDPLFVGRAGAFSALTAALATHPPAVVVDGPAGIGKTALAVRWSAGVAEDFPGGQLYVNLRGYDPAPPLTPLAALRLLLDGLSAPTVPADPDAAGNLYRTLTAGRRVLVLLDNARDAEQVRPLLPGAGSLAVVTSRDQMRGLVARDGARRITLGPLDRAEAARIFPPVSPAAGAAPVSPAAGAAPVRPAAAGGFPLTLRIAAERAARLPSAPVEELPEELWTALSWSYAALDPETARVFRSLGHGAIGTHLDPRSLDRLVEVHLVEQDPAGRHRLLDPVRAFAARLCPQPALALGA
jgi:DNA-binding SARP family transcriptional activator